MVKCRICHQEIPADELAAHLLEDHPRRVPPTRLAQAEGELKSLNRVLGRLERQGVALADYAQGFRKLANILGVTIAEVRSLQREIQGIDEDLGALFSELGKEDEDQ